MRSTYRSLLSMLVLAAVVVWISPAAAQTDDEVHIRPRIAEPAAAASAAASVPNGPLTDLNTHTRPIRSDVDLVLVPVTITDPMDRLVTGLDKENFQIYEGDRAEPIRTFATDDAPISVGILFDMSGSMADKLEKSREAVVQFMQTANPLDEFFMITFNDKPDMISGFTNDIEKIQGKLVFTNPKGMTSLLDAIYLGLDEMKHAKYERKALLVISDGGDNHSRYTENEIKSRVKEADVQMYAIGLFDSYGRTTEERFGPQLLGELTDVTGGRTFTIENPNDLADVATKISTELRNEYVIGYKPNPKPHDGKWHKIKVKLLPPKGLPPLHVTARTGYYAAEK
ncbi:MAG TPA: VWA domain-containing protein [Terriglobales bacterium]|nr:VWA domain-containing protein [Terriglobales bacterium]